MSVSHDRYELLESLGKNDYLSVHRAWDRKINRFVAIMELDRRFRANEQQYAHVWDEILGFAAIKHDGLVQVYEIDKERGWIITELMNGTVAAQIASAPLSNTQVRGILRAGLDALGYLHQRGKVHGDIRPSNLLINDNGNVRLSRPVGLALGGQIPAIKLNQKYLAPELLKSELFGEPGPATDLYCLGFAAYELLVGPGFDDRVLGTKGFAADEGAFALSWLRWHSAESPRLPPVKELVSGVASDLANVIDRLVSRRVADRPSTAASVLSTLGEVDAEEAIFPTSSTPAKPLPAPVPVRPPGGKVPANSKRPPSNPTSEKKPSTGQKIPSGSTQLSAIQNQPKNPWVFRSIAAVVLIGAAFVGLMLQPVPVPDPDVPPSIVSDTGQQSTSSLVSAAGELKAAMRELKTSIDMGREEHEKLIAALTDRKPQEVLKIPPEPLDEASKLIASAQQHLSAGEFDAAIADFERARTLSPFERNLWCDGLIRAYCERGSRYRDGKKYRLAIDDFDHAVELATDRGAPLSVTVVREALFGRGVSYLEIGWTDKALEDLTDVIEAIPDSHPALIKRGIVLTQLGRYPEAMEDFNRALKLDRESYSGFNNRGVCHLRLGKYDEAVQDFTEAVRIDSRPAHGFYNRHFAYRYLGEKAKAEHDLEKAMEIDPLILSTPPTSVPGAPVAPPNGTPLAAGSELNG